MNFSFFGFVFIFWELYSLSHQSSTNPNTNPTTSFTDNYSYSSFILCPSFPVDSLSFNDKDDPFLSGGPTSLTSYQAASTATSSRSFEFFSIFHRFRPYIDKLMLQYTEPTTTPLSSSMDGPESILLAYDAILFNHKTHQTDETFQNLLNYFHTIIEFKRVDFIRRLVEMEATPLGLTVLALAPLPHEYFYDFKALVNEKTVYRDDGLLQYLISLKTGSEHNSYSHSHDISKVTQWMNTNVPLNKFSSFTASGQFGNLLNYNQIYSRNDDKSLTVYILATRAKCFETGFSEMRYGRLKGPDGKFYLKFKISAEPADELFKNSLLSGNEKLKYTLIDCTESTSPVFEASRIVESDAITETTKLIMINKTPNLVLTFGGQIEQVFEINNLTFYLEAIILIYPTDNTRSLLLFDIDVHMWTLFVNDMILAVPNWVALQLGFNHGSTCIYNKTF